MAMIFIVFNCGTSSNSVVHGFHGYLKLPEGCFQDVGGVLLDLHIGERRWSDAGRCWKMLEVKIIASRYTTQWTRMWSWLWQNMSTPHTELIQDTVVWMHICCCGDCGSRSNAHSFGLDFHRCMNDTYLYIYICIYIYTYVYIYIFAYIHIVCVYTTCKYICTHYNFIGILYIYM